MIEQGFNQADATIKEIMDLIKLTPASAKLVAADLSQVLLV